MIYTTKEAFYILLLLFSLSHWSLAAETHNRLIAQTSNVISSSLEENDVKIITLEDDKITYFTLNITTSYAYFIFQVHSKYRNITLSRKYDDQEKYTSSNSALLKLLPSDEEYGRYSGSYYTYDLSPSKGTDYQALVTANTFNMQAPIPGGCCLTCSLNVDPNIVITSPEFYKTTFTFHMANVHTNDDCSGKPNVKPEHYRLQYTIYQYFLQEGNLHNHELFLGLRKMLTPSAVKKYGEKVEDWYPDKDIPSITLNTIRGQGIIINLLVHDPITNQDAVYSPVVTYGCSFTAKVDGCDSIGSIVNSVLAVVGALLSLIISFAGHRLYHLYILSSCSILFAFPGFILLTNLTNWSHTVRMVVSVVIGVFLGILVYLFWRLTKYRRIVLFICGQPFGFLLAAILFFTPFGDMVYWKNDINFWTVFFCTSVTLPFLFLLCLKPFVIIVSSFVGGYGVVVGIDMFIRSSLSYIVLTIVVRATEDDFIRYDLPFQKKDYILCALWCTLVILGIISQTRISRGQQTLRAMPQRNKDIRNKQMVGRKPKRSKDLVNINGDADFYVVDNESEPILSTSSHNVNSDVTRYGTNAIC